MTFFETQRLNEHIVKIDTPYFVSMYLILGEKRAALIDTGFGIGDLRGIVENLTDLPYDVICTHGHVDHAGGTSQFADVYLNKKDWALERAHTEVSFRKAFAKALSGNMPREEDMVAQRKTPYHNLEEGQTFDLGGLTLEAIACPGHTPGCMTILIKEMRLLLLGDACNSKTFLFFPEALPVKEYLLSLERLEKREADFDHAIFFHADNFEDKNNIQENIEVCREILNGTDDRISKNLLGYDVFIAKAVNGDDHRIDGKSANIYYAADKV